MRYRVRFFPRKINESPYETTIESPETISDVAQLLLDTLQLRKDHIYYSWMTIEWDDSDERTSDDNPHV